MTLSVKYLEGMKKQENILEDETEQVLSAASIRSLVSQRVDEQNTHTDTHFQFDTSQTEQLESIYPSAPVSHRL